MSEFNEGDIVQVITTESLDEFPEQGKLARDFYGVSGTPHPFYGMIGFVYETRPNGIVCVFFSKSYTNPEANNMPGWTGKFRPEQLTKVGTAAVQLPYAKLKAHEEQLSKMFAEYWNKQFGTNFKSQDDVMDSIIKEGKDKPVRKIRLQAVGFSKEAREHLFDKIKKTTPDQALTWQGVLDGNTINPFIKNLDMGETVAITALEGDTEVATFDTVFLRCNTLNIINPHNVEVRLEFRNK